VFNLGDSAQTIKYSWTDLGLGAKSYKVRNLWERKDAGAVAGLTATLRPHSSVLYRVTE
jgi:alpha-galactosidase